MKHLIIILLAIPFLALSQNFPLNENGKIEYSEVITVPDVNKQELYQRGRQWMAETFNSSESVIDYENEEAGKIIGKGAFAIKATGLGAGGTIHKNQAGHIKFYLQLEFKDGRYKYKVYNLKHNAEFNIDDLRREESNKKMFIMNKTWKNIRIEADEGIRSLINSLVDYTKSKPSQSDDW